VKVVEIRDSFGADSLQLVERPEPVPGPGQVLLKMKAFSINYRDLRGYGRRTEVFSRMVGKPYLAGLCKGCPSYNQNPAQT
jgi:NADPH:quinone reductase-like Zn-dependent oxidoreductase